jgi:hypothetical protein
MAGHFKGLWHAKGGRSTAALGVWRALGIERDRVGPLDPKSVDPK